MSVALEVCAASIASAIAAQAAGATRIELCSLLEVGGITPSHGLIKAAKDRLNIPIHVLVRPRTGGFVYSEAEIEIIKQDIEVAGQLGCEGIAVGVLTKDGRVDVPTMTSLAKLAKRWNMQVTFHRAFDDVEEWTEALQDVINSGCSRILTSGGAASSEEPAARDRLKQLVKQAGREIVVMPGAGITIKNVATLVATTGACEVHASCKRVVRKEEQETSSFSADRWETDEGTVKQMVGILRTLEV